VVCTHCSNLVDILGNPASTLVHKNQACARTSPSHRLAIFEPYVQDQLYGNLRYTLLFLKYLDRSQFEPIVFAPKLSRYSEYVREAGASYICVPAAGTLLLTGRKLLVGGAVGKVQTLASLLFYNLRVGRELKRHKIDILQCNNLRAVLMAGIGARLAGCPVVFYVKSLLTDTLLDRVGLKIAHQVIFQNEVLLQRYGRLVQSGRMALIRNGVDPQEIEHAESRSLDSLTEQIALDY
jgi:hypothetical protein